MEEKVSQEHSAWHFKSDGIYESGAPITWLIIWLIEQRNEENEACFVIDFDWLPNKF